jgi:putative ABC transport system ATP-binding protein
MSEAVLEANDIVQFLGQGAGRVQALKGVSLSLMTPASGTVRIAGQSTEGADPEALAKLRRDHIGFIFQSYHLFPTLTAEENIRLALDVRGDSSRRAIEAARNVLARVGLSHKQKSRPLEMSGGEQQRIAVARAIVGNAKAILADEPTGALDTENGQAIMALLAEIAKDPGRAVLVVTHDPRTVAFADRIIHIEDGRIVGEERPSPIRKASNS